MNNRLHRLLAIAAFLLFATVTASWGEIVDRVVAVVNDDVVTQYELQSTVDLVLARYEHSIRPEDRARVTAEARRAVLNKLISDLLLRQEARRLGISVRDDEVNNAIQENMRQRKITMDELQQALMKDGTNFEKYREATRSDLIKMRIIQREIRPRVSVTSEEIGAFYQEHRDEYEGKLRMRLQMIALTVPAGADAAARDAQRLRADAALKRIRGGEPFEVVANEYSGGPRTGGDIGYVEKGSLNPAIDEVAFSLKPGEVSDVIETPQGFYILRALDRRGGGSLTVRATRESVEDRIYREKLEKKYDEWLAERRQKAHIEIRL